VLRRAFLLPILGAYTLVSVLKPHPAKLDERRYLEFAHHLTHGFYAQVPSPDPGDFLWRGPGLPSFLTPFVALHAPLWLMRIVAGPVLVFLALVVFNMLAELYVSKRTALIATYALALYLPFFTVMGEIYVEPLATLCLTLAVFFMVRSYRGGRHDHLFAGAALAVLALSRVEFGYVLLACLVLAAGWVIKSPGSAPTRRSALAALVALLLCTPWLGYTYSLTHKPFYWGNSGGLSLYWMTAPGNLGDWHNGTEVATIKQLAPVRPFFNSLQTLGPVARDEKLQHVAFRNIKADPAHYLANAGNNVARLLFNVPYSFGEAKAPLSFSREKDGAVIYALPNALLLVLLAIAVAVAVRTRPRRAELLPIAVLLTLGFAIHIPLAAYARFTIPLVPAAAWLVTATCCTLPTWSISSLRARGSTAAG